MNITEFYALPVEQRRSLMTEWRLDKGATYLEIADMLGTSRNAVAGLCHRLGVKLGKEQHVKAEQRGARRGGIIRRQQLGFTPDRKVKLVKTTKPIPISAAWRPVEGAEPILLYKTTNKKDHGQCRWPVGGVKDHLVVCGCEVEAFPYCPEHTALAYRGDSR